MKAPTSSKKARNAAPSIDSLVEEVRKLTENPALLATMIAKPDGQAWADSILEDFKAWRTMLLASLAHLQIAENAVKSAAKKAKRGGRWGFRA